ncbi:MAG: hypothetical protein GY814_17175 [Gammaproteobacteria bacterium]|nr:hypothetical protein [Gammaproteobacteria bacterium]
MNDLHIQEWITKTPKERWLILPIEAKVREFEAKVFLGCMAAEKGFSVLVGHYGVINRWAECLPRGILLEKNISVRYKSWLNKLRNLGFRLCVNDEESLVLFSDEESWTRVRMNREMVGLVDYVFAWSEGHADLIRRKYPEYSDKVYASGTPRVDMLRKEMHPLYFEEVARLKERFGNYILMPSNFGALINVRGENFMIDQLKRHGYVKSKDEENKFKDRLVHERLSLDAFVRAFKRIRKEFPEHAIVVRPHPLDNHEVWRESVKNVENAHVVYEGNITPWLLAADAIFHCGCTTGLEARVLERCSVAYHPYFNERFDNQPSTVIGPVVCSEDELISFIQDGIKASGNCPLDLNDIDKFVCSVEGRFASEKIVDLLENLSIVNDDLNLTWTNPRALKVKTHEWVRRKRNNLRSKNEEMLKRSKQKWPGANLGEMQLLIDKYSELTGRYHDLSVKQVVGDLFYISRDSTD